MLAGIIAYVYWAGSQSNGTSLDWAKTGADRVVQNVVNLINTAQYEVAYDRTLGLPSTYIDKPLDQAIAEVTTAIFELIGLREPRAEVKEVTFLGTDDSGNMEFKVVIDIVGY